MRYCCQFLNIVPSLLITTKCQKLSEFSIKRLIISLYHFKCITFGFMALKKKWSKYNVKDWDPFHYPDLVYIVSFIWKTEKEKSFCRAVFYFSKTFSPYVLSVKFVILCTPSYIYHHTCRLTRCCLLINSFTTKKFKLSHLI